MSGWFRKSSKKVQFDDTPVVVRDRDQELLDAISELGARVKSLEVVVREQSCTISKLLESQRLIIAWQRGNAETDARQLNLSLRGYARDKTQATKFVPSVSKN